MCVIQDPLLLTPNTPIPKTERPCESYQAGVSKNDALGYWSKVALYLLHLLMKLGHASQMVCPSVQHISSTNTLKTHR